MYRQEHRGQRGPSASFLRVWDPLWLPLCLSLRAPTPVAPMELPPAAAPGPFSALFPTRFILDDSALYLSDKCEMETPDLQRGGQALDWAPSPLRAPSHTQSSQLSSPRCWPVLTTHIRVHARKGRI